MLHGAPGFRYLVEKTAHSVDPVWDPYVIVTNVSGTATFSDGANSASAVTFYRARILD